MSLLYKIIANILFIITSSVIGGFFGGILGAYLFEKYSKTNDAKNFYMCFFSGVITLLFYLWVRYIR